MCMYTFVISSNFNGYIANYVYVTVHSNEFNYGYFMNSAIARIIFQKLIKLYSYIIKPCTYCYII